MCNYTPCAVSRQNLFVRIYIVCFVCSIFSQYVDGAMQSIFAHKKYISAIYILLFFCVGVSCSAPEPIETTQTLPIYPAPKSDRAKIRHILVGYEGAWRSGSRRSKTDARSQIEAILKELHLGANFAEIANNISEDPTKNNGGLLPIVTKGSMLPEFESVAFALHINEISDIVETGFGFHIIQRLELDERELVHMMFTQPQSPEFITEVYTSIATVGPVETAKKYSQAPFGTRGGELGWFERTDLHPRYQEIVFSLEIATCSDIIEENNNAHIFCRTG